MYIVVVGKLEENPTAEHRSCFVGDDKQALITRAIETKKLWEGKPNPCGGKYGPYDIWFGTIESSIQPVPPVVQYREVAL